MNTGRDILLRPGQTERISSLLRDFEFLMLRLVDSNAIIRYAVDAFLHDNQIF